ncbi:hypothetical protein MSAN_02096700 [Mycena sanguinolenta]|uniref:Uncharacterized protein n=1 Tax=Mycena sanguinolenta TaxID=230812 RepID=A0A8H6XHY0_9AGAR|nr:hypothetical protein MSAN_02096700 [Mycena sanguinolenta]
MQMARAAEVGRCDATFDVVSFCSIPEHPLPRRSLLMGAAHPFHLIACLAPLAGKQPPLSVSSTSTAARCIPCTSTTAPDGSRPPPRWTLRFTAAAAYTLLVRLRRTASVSVVGCDFGSTHRDRRLRLRQRARGQDDPDGVVNGQQHEVIMLDVFQSWDRQDGKAMCITAGRSFSTGARRNLLEWTGLLSAHFSLPFLSITFCVDRLLGCAPLAFSSPAASRTVRSLLAMLDAASGRRYLM